MNRRLNKNLEFIGPARRRVDKIFSLIFFVLLVFLINWILGCSGIEIKRLPEVADCSYRLGNNDPRCDEYFKTHIFIHQ